MATTRATRALEFFGRWFGSGPGVWQTFGFCLVVVVFEYVHPAADPDHFQLLFWLTVYSAVTQPILAYVSSRNEKDTDVILERIERLEEKIAKKLGIDDDAAG